MNRVVLFVLGWGVSFLNQACAEDIAIVTVDSPLQSVLQMKTEDIQRDEWPLAQEILRKLFSALKPHLPAAGLAAPQIGISKSIFIFSFDRDPTHLEGVINPSWIPCGEEKVEGWEGCFSVFLSNGRWSLAQLSRYQRIQVQYLDINGEKVEKILEGFAAKVFQHEYDHLQGIVNIHREDAKVLDFTTKEECLSFLQEVKKEDALRYQRPN